MKIIIICSSFPPDTHISAVRPYHFAHYLAQWGHDVTVLAPEKLRMSPGLLFETKEERFRIYRYPDGGRPSKRSAERQRPHDRIVSDKADKGHPRKIKDIYWRSRRRIKWWISNAKELTNSINHTRQILRLLKQYGMDSADIVFSTYSPIENIFAGRAASKFLRCKWVLDFRDSLIMWKSRPLFMNVFIKVFMPSILRKAECCTCFSKGSADIMKRLGIRTYIIYNGYSSIGRAIESTDKYSYNGLVICSTGSLYLSGRQEKALDALASLIGRMISDHKLTKESIRFIVAGHNSEKFEEIFRNHYLGNMVDNLGFISNEEAERVKADSDIHLALAWNFGKETGYIPAKLYGGIRWDKPVLGIVSGDKAGSEMKGMIEKYKMGDCFECVEGREMQDNFCTKLLEYVNEKKKKGKISFSYTLECRKKFNFENLTAELEEVMLNL